MVRCRAIWSLILRAFIEQNSMEQIKLAAGILSMYVKNLVEVRYANSIRLRPSVGCAS